MNLIEISIRRRVTIAMFTISILLFGLVSLSRLKMNLLPDLSFPTLTVRTEYLGAAPAEVENLISKPVEEAVGIVKNVMKVSSISRAGQSDVLLEFDWGTNMDFASLEVREKLDALQLPMEVQRPVILRFDPSLDPILRLGLYYKAEADTLPLEPAAKQARLEDRLKYLRRFSEEEIKKDLESAPGVAAVKVSGGLEEEIQVLVDPHRLSQLNLTIDDIARQLRAENVNLSGGRLEEGTRQYLVRTLNQFQSVSEIGDLVIARTGATPTYLRDVATVDQGFREREAITRMRGAEAVEIAIYKEGDANTVSVARTVTNRLERVRSNLPPNFSLDVVYDQSTFISQAVGEVVNAALIGGLLAVIILYFFLQEFWTTVIISVSIPVSVIATFNLMYGNGLSLNIMSLGGIALGIGLLVDNSIVVLENISRHRSRGKDPATAARDGAGEVSMAVTASTLTSVAVFFPLVFVKGIAGQLFRDQALTVTFALLASLAVALTLIPMLASLGGREAAEDEQIPLPEPQTRAGRGVRWVRVFLFTTAPVFFVHWLLFGLGFVAKLFRRLFRPLSAGFNRGYQIIERIYPRVLGWALDHGGLVLILAFGLFASSLVIGQGLGVELIPQLSQGEFAVELKLPPGTPLEKTDRAITKIQLLADELDRVEYTFAVAGSGNRLDANPEQSGENWGELSVALDPGSKRADEDAVMSSLRRELSRVPGLEYKFARPTLFTTRTPIEVEISGFDLRQLKRVSGDIAALMEASPRFADVKSTMAVGQPEIQIFFDRERAAALGLSVYQIANRVVDRIRGNVATRYSWRDRKIDVLVRSQEGYRASVDDVRNLVINPESSRPLPLEAVADVVVDAGPGEIHRVSQQRVALVTANLTETDLAAAAAEIDEIIDQVPMPVGLDARLTGQNEQMAVSFRSLQFALALAVFMVYLVMASQFESLLHPFVILFTIPLALTGAFLALWITGSTISVVVLIGVILLAGIVVNNAIVLVDRVNQLRSRGMEKREALMEAGLLRLRPILMTTLTTVLGLSPLALGFGEGAEVRAPMAITVIGGLVVATLLTLVVIPVMYTFLDRKSYAVKS
ncbi:MAG: efflux RND transporter permease subunit [Candidatus Neomarinimicrobiota bacterium]